MKKFLLGLTLLALPTYAGEDHPITFASTVGELRFILETLPQDQPLGVAVGKYKAAPVKISELFMVKDNRPYWWDKSLDTSGTLVIVLTETTIEETSRDIN